MLIPKGVRKARKLVLDVKRAAATFFRGLCIGSHSGGCRRRIGADRGYRYAAMPEMLGPKVLVDRRALGARRHYESNRPSYVFGIKPLCLHHIAVAVLPHPPSLSKKSTKMSPPSAIDVDVQAIDDTTAVTIPNPLTLESVATRRAATGKLIAGVAAVANVDSFKGEKQHLHKPRAKRWDRRC